MVRGRWVLMQRGEGSCFVYATESKNLSLSASFWGREEGFDNSVTSCCPMGGLAELTLRNQIFTDNFSMRLELHMNRHV